MKVRLPILLLLCILTFISEVAAQEKARTLVIKNPDASATLIDEFGMLTSEDRSARFDNLYTQLTENPGSTGYVLLFCGKKCRYDEIVAHMRGIEVKIGLKNFDRSRFVIQNAGFRETFKTELWFAPTGACAPEARSTVSVRDVKFSRARVNAFEAYECCD